VHRRAKHAGIPAVAFESRLARLSRDEPLGFFLEVHRRDSVLYKLLQSLQHLVDNQPGAMHFFELFRAAQMNRHVPNAPAFRLTRSAKHAASLHPRSSPHPPGATIPASCSTRPEAKSVFRTHPAAAR